MGDVKEDSCRRRKRTISPDVVDVDEDDEDDVASTTLASSSKGSAPSVGGTFELVQSFVILLIAHFLAAIHSPRVVH